MTSAPPTAPSPAPPDEHRSATHGISRWEWAVAALGALLLVGALSLLMSRGFAGPRRPPSVGVSVRDVQRVPDAWLVRFEATNRGDETMTDLQVRASLSRGGQVVETAEAAIDHLPGRSARRGGIFLREDPRSGTLEIVAVGYQEP